MFDRSFWLRQFQRWHWISAAICLIGMVLFAATGITLNHAGSLESKPVVTMIQPTSTSSILSVCSKSIAFASQNFSQARHLPFRK